MRIAYKNYGSDTWQTYDNVQIRDERGTVLFARKGPQDSVGNEWFSVDKATVPYVRDLVRCKDIGPPFAGVAPEPEIHPRRLQILEATPEEKASVFLCLEREMGYRKRLRRHKQTDIKDTFIDSSKERT